MAQQQAYDPLADPRSRAYLALVEIREVLAQAGLEPEAAPLIEALRRLIGRMERPGNGADH